MGQSSGQLGYVILADVQQSQTWHVTQTAWQLFQPIGYAGNRSETDVMVTVKQM